MTSKNSNEMIRISREDSARIAQNNPGRGTPLSALPDEAFASRFPQYKLHPALTDTPEGQERLKGYVQEHKERSIALASSLLRLKG